MISLASLWLPILLSTALVFVASSIVWMVLPIHKKDYKRLGPSETKVLDFVRSLGLSAGIYMFPACDPATMKSDPTAKERAEKGPWGTISVLKGPPNMGLLMGMWAVNLVIISTLVAYVLSHAGLKPDAPYLSVFRIAATVATMAYAGNALTDSIWKGRPWSHFPGALFDGVLYGLLTAGAFAWRWHASTAG